VHLVTRGHFRSRDKDGGHTIRTIRHSRKPYAARKLHGFMFYRTVVIAERSFTLQGYGFSTFVAPVTRVTLTLIR